jgi:hypothetical protein
VCGADGGLDRPTFTSTSTPTNSLCTVQGIFGGKEMPEVLETTGFIDRKSCSDDYSNKTAAR